MTKEQLLSEIDRSRLAVSRDFRAIKGELDVASKVNRAFQKDLWPGWVGRLRWGG
jgi:hypothetical protein